MSDPPSRARTLAVALVSAIALALALAPPVSAGPLVDSAADCDTEITEQPFLPWADPAAYVLVPNGILEGAARWTMRGDAKIASGNEPFYVHGDREASSLRLPGDSSARTDAMCVGVEYPTLRFFARNGGSPLSQLRVEVLFEDAAGKVKAQEIAMLLGEAAWQPTPPLPLAVNLLPLLPGERTAVAFRFTSVGVGDWSVDDVYVDPWRHG